MSFDIQHYYAQFTTAIDEILNDGYQSAIDSGQLEGYDDDAHDVGRHDGLIGSSFFWNKSDVVLTSDNSDYARLSAQLIGDRIAFRADKAIDWVQYLDLTTGATYVEDVVVIGQRRDFPSQPFPIPSTGPDQPNTVPNPCTSASTAKPWNADAAAAGSIADFLQKAQEIGFADAPNGIPTLGNREFGRGLASGPNNSIWGNAPSYGPPTTNPTSTLTIDFTGINNANYIGDIHTHPNGNPLPSQSDWDGFMANNLLARQYGRVNETFYMYIGQVGPNGQIEKVLVYEDGPRSVNSPNPPRPTTIGQEVNLNAQPCP